MKITHEWDLTKPAEKEEYDSVKNAQYKIEKLNEQIGEIKKSMVKIHNYAGNILYELEKSLVPDGDTWLKRTMEEIQSYAKV